jgi:hypothetical protein
MGRSSRYQSPRYRCSTHGRFLALRMAMGKLADLAS